MTMHASTEFYEASVNILVNGTEKIIITSSKPADTTQALAAALAWGACTSTDLVVLAGTSGITLTVSSNADIIAATTLESTGIAGHICLVSSSDDILYYITTCTTKKLASGDTVTMPAWTITIVEPTSD